MSLGTNLLRRASGLLVLALALSVTSCKVEAANAAPPPVELALVPLEQCAPERICFLTTWPAVVDKYGPADKYRVHAISGPTIIDTTVTAPPLSFELPCAPGASGTVSVDVWSIRRNTPSTNSAKQQAKYTCPDIAPPAPDSVQIQRIDSTEIASVIIEPSQVALVEGDSALVTAWRVDLLGRRAVPAHVEWSTSDSSVALIRPVPNTATAWVVAPVGGGYGSVPRVIRFPNAVGT